MNRLTKKLVLSILTVVLTVAALGTTTFAWFTLGNVVELSQFSGQVIADEGLEISLNKSSWHNVINTTDIQAKITELGFEKFNHVSYNGTDFQVIENDNTGLTAADTKTYIELPLYFRSTNLTTVSWTHIELTGDGLTTSWDADVAFVHSDGLIYGPGLGTANLNDNLEKLSQSQITRFETLLGHSPLVLGDFGGSSVPINSANAFRVAVKSGTAEKIYEVGEINNNTILGVQTLQGTGDLIYGAASYYEAKNLSLPFGFNTGQVISTPATFTEVTAGKIDEVGGYDVLTLTNDGVAEGYGKTYGGVLTVYIWVEGYDQEAYNSILNLVVNVALSFEGKE